jgi:hypothetical protein
LIRTSWDTAEVSVIFVGAPKHLWFSILVGAIDSIMEALIIHTGTSPEAIPLWITMKNSITVDQIDFNFETPKELTNDTW